MEPARELRRDGWARQRWTPYDDQRADLRSALIHTCGPPIAPDPPYRNVSCEESIPTNNLRTTWRLTPSDDVYEELPARRFPGDLTAIVG